MVQCGECGYDWMFKARVPSHRLKHSYIVYCPRCGKPVFKRIKRKLKEANSNE